MAAPIPESPPGGGDTLSISAVDGSGTAINVTTETVGVVDRVDFSGDEPLLLIGSRVVKLDEIISVKLSKTSAQKSSGTWRPDARFRGVSRCSAGLAGD